MITLNSTGKDVFVADRFYGCVDEYTYPAGKLVRPQSGGLECRSPLSAAVGTRVASTSLTE